MPLLMRSPDAAPTPCKICGGESPLFDVADFHKSCEELNNVFLARAGVPVYYRRCVACGFLFTDAFDDWSPDLFQANIYNDGYAGIDPDYLEKRPANNAAFVAHVLRGDRGRLRVLDWGGGNGRFAAALRAAAFAGAETYDPFTPAFARPFSDTFDLVTSFETLEHLPDPAGGIAAIAARVGEPGAALFTTMLQPEDIERQRLSWWYAAPRNGHVSLFSADALAHAWARHGFTIRSLSAAAHLAFRKNPPDFCRPLFGA